MVLSLIIKIGKYYNFIMIISKKIIFRRGKLSDLRIYSKALTQDDVTNIYLLDKCKFYF